MNHYVEIMVAKKDKIGYGIITAMIVVMIIPVCIVMRVGMQFLMIGRKKRKKIDLN